MMLWDCTHCGMVRHAPCAGATCLPAQRIDEREFKSARIAREQQRIEQIQAERENDPFFRLGNALAGGVA